MSETVLVVNNNKNAYVDEMATHRQNITLEPSECWNPISITCLLRLILLRITVFRNVVQVELLMLSLILNILHTEHHINKE